MSSPRSELPAETPPPAGRYAPSPSGDLHVGNLRTAVLAWAFARSQGLAFRLRIEDLDRVQEGAAQRQMADLRALGLDWDEPVLVQSQREEVHRQAVQDLSRRGLTFECFCTRREIREQIERPAAPRTARPGPTPAPACT